jgi:aminopeptidase C
MAKIFYHYKHKRLIKQIINLCFEVNAKTDFSAHFSANGHVSTFDVSIKENKETFLNEIYRCWTFASSKDLKVKLIEAKTTLENILKDDTNIQ